MSINKTFDGKPLCMGVSGFGHYKTERADAPNYPPAVLSPADILEMIRELTSLCSDPKFSDAVNTLKAHVEDMNNPHHTTLSQFSESIAEVLYKEFIARTKSVISLDEFKKALFETIHIATDAEINEGVCTTAVLSVFGARKYLSQHDTDPNAHQALFDRIIPGDPILEDPSFAWYPQYGISEYYIKPLEVELTEAEEKVPYTYVGMDGYIHTEEEDVLPVDYVHQIPLVPFFSTRKNLIVDSLSCTIFKQNNLRILEEAEEAPDKTITATAIYQNDEVGRWEVNLVYPNCILPPKQPRTFSIFVKADDQKNVKIEFQDSYNVDLPTYAIYNLADNTCFIINHLENYQASLQKLSNGWYRCCFSMYNKKGVVSDLKITFFDHQEMDSNDFMTDANGKISAYVWGIQYEDGFQPSPYIPTRGKIGVRPGIQIVVPVDDWYRNKAQTFHIDYWKPTNDPTQDTRPLLVMRNGEKAAMDISHVDQRVCVKRFYTYSEIGREFEITTLQDEVTPPDTSVLQVTHGLDNTKTLTRVNTLLSMKSKSDLLHNPGTDLYVGCSPDGLFLNGYIGDIIFYPLCVSENEAQFLNGEAYE